MKFTSKVIHGRKHGRTIGYPTANLEVTDVVKQALDKEGVYAVKVNDQYAGALFYGQRTLFKEDKLVCEILLLDFAGDLYGEEIEIEVIKYLRETVAVRDESDLKELIREDIKQTKLVVRN